MSLFKYQDLHANLQFFEKLRSGYDGEMTGTNNINIF